jgi:hypothetical protein
MVTPKGLQLIDASGAKWFIPNFRLGSKPGLSYPPTPLRKYRTASYRTATAKRWDNFPQEHAR